MSYTTLLWKEIRTILFVCEIILERSLFPSPIHYNTTSMTDSSTPSDRLNPSNPPFLCARTISITTNTYANFFLLFAFRRCIPASFFRSGSSWCCQQLWWRVSPETLHLLPVGLLCSLFPSVIMLLPQVALGDLGTRSDEHHRLWAEHWLEDWRREKPEEEYFDWILDSSLECKFIKQTNQSNKIIVLENIRWNVF